MDGITAIDTSSVDSTTTSFDLSILLGNIDIQFADDTGLILQVIFLAVMLILIVSIFVKPRYRVHFFSLTFIVAVPLIAIIFINPIISDLGLDQLFSSRLIT